MTESDTTPDPVEETAPEAPPAPDDVAREDEATDPGDEAQVLPVAGASGNGVPPQPTVGR